MPKYWTKPIGERRAVKPPVLYMQEHEASDVKQERKSGGGPKKQSLFDSTGTQMDRGKKGKQPSS